MKLREKDNVLYHYILRQVLRANDVPTYLIANNSQFRTFAIITKTAKIKQI